MRRLLGLPFKTRCCGAHLTGTLVGWWDNGEDQEAKSQWSSQTWADSKSGMCLIPARHPGQHPPGTGTSKDPPCLHRNLLSAHRLCRGIPKRSWVYLRFVFFLLASQESSLKILLRNDSLGSSSGIILQSAGAAAGCQAALIPGSFPTLTGCRAQNNCVTVTNENSCLSL